METKPFEKIPPQWQEDFDTYRTPSRYRVSHKKVYPFEADLENIKYKDLAYLSHTIG